MAKKPVQVNQAQLQQIEKVLKKMSTDNLRPFLADVGRRLVQDFKMGFRRSMAPDGSSWQGLKYREGQPLRLTRRLQDSIDHRVQGKTVEVGTNVKYGPTHQYGLDTIQVPEHTRIISKAFGKPLKFPVAATVKAHTKDANVPARPFLGIHQRQRSKIVKAFEAHIENLTNGKASKL